MKVVVAKTQKEIIDNMLVRGYVFVIEQVIDWEIEYDGLDQECILFTAYIDDLAVGAARLYKNKVGRVATLKQYRKQGIGSALMKAIEVYAEENNIPYLKLHAQLYVKDFYEHLGYVVEGNIFQEAEIDHVLMVKYI
ncbi:MAG: GNAT family N-acetyltransferase [Candidatus Izimaplasma sp.]|nr:GNAT family N-acetyltransferase [Candidatus Izimaplasma bacterium]